MVLNKKLLVAVSVLCLGLNLEAQIAKWLVRPNYDSIEMVNGMLLEVSQNGKYGLLDKSGKKILPLEYDSISPFKDDIALLFKAEKFYGITDTKGKVVSLQERDYMLVPGADHFNDRMLLVKRNKNYYYIDADGNQTLGPFAEAYPFYEGFACVRQYEDYIKKPQETYYDFVSVNGTEFTLKKHNKKDICFMSSFHNGSAVIVVKKKFFKVDSGSLELTPISLDSTMNKKSLVVAVNKEIPVMKQENEDNLVYAKNGIFMFDRNMRLKLMHLRGNDSISYDFPEEEVRIYTSSFGSIEKDGIYGLTYENKQLLPPQFEEVLHLEDNLAIVKVDDKCGVLTVDEENKFVFKLNNNESIGFNHQYYDAKLTTLMPPYIKCSSATVATSSEDCEIQIESRIENENVEGNTLAYNCRLSIPKDLTDTLTTHDYFYSLKYDGLQSIPHKVSISEWYVKYYEVKLSNTQFTTSSINDTITVEFDLIKTDVARNDKSNYFKNIDVVASNFSEQPILTKITENHYAFQIYGIDQERINFSVKITEVGCPTIEYPFEMIFTKPKPKEKNKKTTITIAPVQKIQPVQSEPKQEIILLE